MPAGPSLYRRHRPRTFADVVGQEHIVRTLSHAVERGSVHHAYLFVGPRGTGKTSMAKILAACLNCVNGPTTEPCGVCEPCTSIANATSLDVIEMDAASNNSVDDIRELREKVAYAPLSGRHKVYILDEAHMLSSQAWNAFLKTLEEPPPRTIFVLATTEAQKVLPTVADRCHRFDFGRPSTEQLATVVQRVAREEAIELDPGATALIARHATGSFRDALGTLEQLVTYTGDQRIEAQDVLAVLGIADAEQLFAALDAVLARDPARALRVAAELARSGRDSGQVLRDLEIHARELLCVQVLGEVPPELRVTPERDERLAQQAAALHETDAVRLLHHISAALGATADGAEPRIQLELVLIKAAAPQLDPSLAGLQARVERLEAGQPPAAPRAAAAAPARDTQPEPVPDRAPEPVLDPRPEPVPDPRPDPVSERKPEPPAGGNGAAVAASAKAATAANTATPPGPPDDLEALIALWPAVVDMVRAVNAMIAAVLEAARPLALSGSELTLAFPSGAAFLKRKAEQEEHRRVTGEALRKVTGQALVLRFELAELPASGAEEPQAAGEELVRAFMEEFNAQELVPTETEVER